MNQDHAPHEGVYHDIHAVYDTVEITPGLPFPQTSATRAVFDYRHVVHAEDSRRAVAAAQGTLSRVFATGFTPETETAGDGTPRYLLAALLPSGLTLIIISRFAPADEPARPELAEAAA